MNNLPTLRRVSVATATLALALALTACGDDDNSDADPTDELTSAVTEPTDEPTETDDVLSVEELATAHLTAADIPAGYVQGVPDEDDDENPFVGTCLEAVDDFDTTVGTEPASESKIEFTLEEEAGQAQISSSIGQYTDDVDVAGAFDTFFASFSGCSSVTTTDDEGVTFDLEVISDDTVEVTGAEQEVNILMSGTLSQGTESFDIVFGLAAIRIGNTVSVVGTSELGGSYGIADQTGVFAQTQADRVSALLG